MLNRKVDCTCQGGQAEDFLCTVVKSKGQRGLDDRGGPPLALRAGNMQPHFSARRQGVFYHAYPVRMHTSRTDPTDHNDTKGAVTVPPVNQV